MAAQTLGTILIIDDDDDLAFSLTCVLRGKGYEVIRAADGEQGVRMACEKRPDLILLDFMMPVMDGFEACREIRQTDGPGNLPIVALTAFGQDIGEIYGLTEEQASSRIRGFLEKPVEPNVLLECVAAALGSQAVKS